VLCCGILAAAGLAAYSNSLANPFLFDDLPLIRDNPDLQQNWQPWRIIFTPTYRSRPVVGVTVGLNYALGGFDVRGYHAVNLAIHILAALALFGVVRRTLRGMNARSDLAGAADWIALASALIWVVHPLQTQAVTYLIQRCEALMGLFYLLALYAVIRAASSSRPAWWCAAAVAACALGMETKQVMLTAPFVALLYDRTFLAGSLREALRRRWRLYAAMAGTWLLLVHTFFLPIILELFIPALRSGQFQFAIAGATPGEYAQTQFAVLAHYLWLSVWPRLLCLDYAWPIATTAAEILPPAALILTLLGLTVWQSLRRRPAGFAGAAAFIILAPTSTLVPTQDLAFEHRMYLPLASLAALAICGGYMAGRWALRRMTASPVRRRRIGAVAGILLVGAVAGALGCRTFSRNEDYRSDLAMWSDIVVKRPGNARAWYTLGNVLSRQGRADEALASYRESLRLDPRRLDALNNLGNLLTTLGRFDEAEAAYRDAIRLNPEHSEIWSNVGLMFALQGKRERAIIALEEALRLDPQCQEAKVNLDRLSAPQPPVPATAP